MEDVRWLGFDWEDRLYYASDYFEQLYEWAVQLIKAGKAYVCDLTAEQIREYRGTLTEPGKNSPYRDRSVEENLDLFERMRAGEFPDGSRTLRAKIDMASPNLNMRDPVMYRILHADASSHAATSGASIRCTTSPTASPTRSSGSRIRSARWSSRTTGRCTTGTSRSWASIAPQQIEFARLNLTYTVMSKRQLLELVKDGYVSGWDDPRMPTICGLRRRGYTPEAIRNFCATDRRVEGRQRGRHRAAGALPARGPEQAGAAGDGRAAAAEGGDRQLSRRPGRGAGGGQQSRRRRHGHAEGAVLARAVHRAGRLPRGCRRRSIYRLAPGQEVRLRYAYLVTLHRAW